MAITITKISVDTPTTPAAAAQEGGELDVGVTYYYRIASFYSYGNIRCVFSTWSAEISATTDATNKQIVLSWDAMTNATGYLIQRSTTSGVYPLDGGGTLRRATQYYGNTPCAVNTNNFTDDNNGLYNWNAQNYDLTDEIPLIDISSDADDAITMSDVYAADVAGGWGVVTMLATAGLQSLASSALRQKAAYFVRGGLRISDCKFTFPYLIYTFVGTIYCYDTVTVTANEAHMFHTSSYVTALAPPDMSTISYKANRAAIHGASGSTFNKVVRRPFPIGIQSKIYYSSLYGVGLKGGTWTNCLVGLRSGNQIPLYDATYTECIFEGMRFYTQGIADAILWGGTPSTRWQSAKKVDGISVALAATHDIEMGNMYSFMFIDPIFNANTNSTQSNPYINQIVFAVSEDKGVNIACNLKLKVIDNNGDAISGATVTIIDKNGANALWEASGAKLTEGVDLTETSITVYDSSVLSADDYIRFELGQEIMKVVSIDNATTITVTRAQLGTVAEYHTGSGSDDTSLNRVLLNIASLTTDADGEAETTFPLISRALTTIYQGSYQSGYEDYLVAANKLNRYYYTPHTVTISKAGYNTRTIKYTMDQKRIEVEKLSPDGTSIQDSTLYDATVY